MALLPQASPLSLQEAQGHCRGDAQKLILHKRAMGSSHTEGTCRGEAAAALLLLYVGSGICPSYSCLLLIPHAFIPTKGRDRARLWPSRWPHQAQSLCGWWSPGKAVLSALGEGSWGLAQGRRRTQRCLKEAFCGEVRLSYFLCPPGAAWCLATTLVGKMLPLLQGEEIVVDSV